MKTTKNGAIGGSENEQSKTWPQYFAVLSALIAMFCSGIHFGWPSPSLPKILSEEYAFEVTPEEASYVTVIGPIGDIAGTILFSALVDSIGRKLTIILIAVPQIASMLMIYFSWCAKELLYVARFVGGLSEGACFCILPIYIGEVSEPRIRGVLGSCFSLVLMLGILFANIVGTFLSIYSAALIFALLPLLFLATFSMMPESPYYLVMKGEIEKTRVALTRLRRKRNVEKELESITADVNRQMSEKGRFKDLIMIKSNRMAAIVMTGLRLIQQFSGVSAFTLYCQLLFKQATDAIPEYLAAILVLILQAAFALVAIMIVDRTGRKPLLLLSAGGCCFALVVEAVFFILRDFTAVDVSNLGLIPLVGMVVFMVAFAMGLGSAVNLMMGELFSASIKAKALCLNTIVLAVSMFSGTKFYQFTADTLGLWVPFSVFAVCQALGVVFCYRYVPETKGKTLEQIQQELKGNKPANSANNQRAVITRY